MNKKIYLFLGIVLTFPSVVYIALLTYEQKFESLSIYGPIDEVTGETRHTIPYFELVDQKGQKQTLNNFKGKIMVVDFFFTYCPSICPKMSRNLQDVQNKFLNDDQVAIVSYTVDPERDNVERLAEYAKNYNSKPGQWFFLTGNKSSIYRLARKGYFITAQDGDGGSDDFIHSEKLVLVDQQKRIRGYYDGTDKAAIKQLVYDINRLKQ